MRGGEDLRTGGQGRGGFQSFFLEKGGGCGKVGVGAVFWKSRTSHLHVPPHPPSRKPGVRLQRVVRPAGTLLCPTLSPQTLTCPLMRADHKRSQNNPIVILVSFQYHFWYHFESFWYHFGCILVSSASLFVFARTLQEGPPVVFARGVPAPPPPNPKSTPPLPSQHPNPCLPHPPASV